MDSHRRHLDRGFGWLGGATMIAKAIDFSTILGVLLFLTKQEVGIASLVVSIATVVEAFDGLGTGDALIQAPSVSKLQLDSLFWFVIGAAALVGGLTLVAAPWIAAIYGVPGMAAFFIAAAIKQPLVGAAVIPIAIMNKELQYERIAIVNVGSTLAAALTRLGLAMAGAGAWALVLGHAASGLYTLVGASIARPYLPSARFSMDAIRPLLRFGMRSAAANIIDQTFKNIDYLLIGWFFGAAPLAVYRVAFDVAMEPAMAVGALVNRTALPVFVRVAAARDDLVRSVSWSLQRVVMLVAPLMTALILLADPLMGLLHDGRGNSYSAAALPLKILAIAACLRVTSQLLPPLMIASGRPGAAARLSAVTFLLLTAGIVVTGVSFDARTGIVAVSSIWLCVYPPLLVWGAAYLRRHWDVGIGALAPAFWAPLAGVAAMVSFAVLTRPLTAGSATAEIAAGVMAMTLTYACLILDARRGLRQA